MYLIREVSPGDAEELRHYAARLFAERLPGVYERKAPTLEEETEYIRAHIDTPGSTMLVATADGHIAGLIGFQARQLPQERHVGMFGVSVDRRHRGEGIGSALISALLEWAPRNGITRVEVEAFAVNEGAIRLYERFGFEREGCRRGAVMIDGTPADVVMLARLMDAGGQGGRDG
jgi:RimJ/RimL family protein N-acetyltransferase